MKKRVEFFFIQKQYEKYTTEDNEYVRKVLTECLFKICSSYISLKQLWKKQANIEVVKYQQGKYSFTLESLSKQ
jgi:hypothetical protein